MTAWKHYTDELGMFFAVIFLPIEKHFLCVTRLFCLSNCPVRLSAVCFYIKRGTL